MAHKIDYKNAVFDKRKWVITENEDGTYTIEDATAYEQEGDVIGADYFNEMGAAMNEAENGIAAAVPKSFVIKSADDLDALTEAGFLPDALLVRQLNKNMGGLSFGKDGDGNYGYYGADGSLIPFKSGPELVARINALSTNTTSGESFEVDCSGINGYKSLTVTSFLFVPITTRVYYDASNFGGTYTSTKEDLNPENLAYDGITGILTGTYAYTNANQSSSGRAGGFKVMAYEVYISGIGSSNTGGSDECNHILQEKTVTPSDVVQEIVADSNYYGLSKVVVEASGVIDEIPTAEGVAF